MSRALLSRRFAYKGVANKHRSLGIDAALRGYFDPVPRTGLLLSRLKFALAGSSDGGMNLGSCPASVAMKVGFVPSTAIEGAPGVPLKVRLETHFAPDAGHLLGTVWSPIAVLFGLIAGSATMMLLLSVLKLEKLLLRSPRQMPLIALSRLFL